MHIDKNESGTVSREEINQGLKKVDRSLHITEEEFVYMLQQAKLPCTQEQIRFPDFSQMIIAEMRNYTNRKVIQGRHWASSYLPFGC